jgi:uncharacterized damage-inducible protein DinB
MLRRKPFFKSHGEKMAEINRIVQQMQAAFNGKAWHGPSVQEILAPVNAAQAAARPIANAHSIWEIVLHISAWHKFVMKRLAGEEVFDVPVEEDWPRVKDTSAAAWKSALQALEQSHRDLCAATARLQESDLSKTVRSSDADHSVYVLLHGVIQHDLYHAGQIALLRKAA